MLKRNSTDESGSVLLAAVFSVTIGVSLALLFSNLVRYVAAQSAVEQAARKVARCLSPTDPDCISVSAKAAEPKLAWFQDIYQPMSRETVNKFDYEAYFTKQTFEATYPIQLTHIIRPELLWTSSTVPRKSFSAELNQFQRIKARVRGCAENSAGGTTPSGISLPNSPFMTFFPHWNYNQERAQNQHADYIPYCMGRSGSGCCLDPDDAGCNVPYALTALPFNYSQSYDYPGAGEVLGAYGTSSWATSQLFYLPQAPTSQASCNAGDGYNCQQVLQATAGGNGDWQNNAQLAVRMAAKVCKTGPYGKVAWSDTPGVEPLQMKVNGGAWTGISRGPEGWEQFSSNCIWFGSYLKGSDGSSHGSGDGEQPVGNLAVPWGSTVQLRGRVRGREFGLRVEEIKFQIIATSYQSSGNVECHDCVGDYLQVPPLQIVEGPATPEECNPLAFASAGGWQWTASPFEPVWPWLTNETIAGIDGSLTSVEPACEDNGDVFNQGTVHQLAAFSPSCSVSAAVCNDSWSPGVEAAESCGHPPADSYRSYCSFSPGVSAGHVSVAESPQGCQTTVTVHSKKSLPAPWNNNASHGNPLAEPEVVALNTVTHAVNATQPPGAPIFSTYDEGELKWQQKEIAGLSLHPNSPNELRQTAQHFDFSWATNGDSGDCSSCTAEQCDVASCVVNNVSQREEYKRVNAAWSPEAGAFGIEAPGNANLVLPYIAQPDANYLRSQVQVELKPNGETLEAVDYIYPFQNKPEFEIPKWGEQRCEEGCQVPHISGFQTLEEALREYVVQGASVAHQTLATDETIELVTGANLVEQYTQVTEPLPPCTPTYAVQSCELAERVFLGEYSVGEMPNGPEICNSGQTPVCLETASVKNSCGGDFSVNGRFGGCSFQASSLSHYAENPVRSNLHLERAYEIAATEIERFDPGSVRGCIGAQSNCYELEIDTDSSMAATVKLRYQMPLTFPLNLFTGKDHMEIAHEKSEIQELKIVGRGV